MRVISMKPVNKNVGAASRTEKDSLNSVSPLSFSLHDMLFLFVHRPDDYLKSVVDNKSLC